MRYSTILIFLFSIALSLRGETLLKINFNDENRPPVNYILEELPKITFDFDNNIVFTTNEVSSKYPYSDVKSYSFDNLEWGSIENTISTSSQESLPFKFFDNLLSFAPVPYQRKIRIYDVTGQILFQYEIPANIAYNKHVGFLRSEAFIITINNLAVKLITK